MTFAIVTPYLVLILPPALWYQNPSTGFIARVGAIAVAGSLVTEWLLGVLTPARGPVRSTVADYGRDLYRVGLFAILASALVGVLAAAAGVGSIQVQVGLATASRWLATANSLVGGWGIIGVGLLLAAYLAGTCSRAELLRALAVLVGGELVEAYLTALTAQLMALGTLLVTMALLLGLIRARVLVVVFLVALALWPAVFELRNEIRTAAGVAVDESVGAYDRLRFDEQIARADGLRVPLELGQPGIVDIVRYGVVPRALDPGRPQVSTGRLINVALGGGPTSAYSFLPVTTTYVLVGPAPLFAWYAGLALLVRLVWYEGRRLTPARTVILTVLMAGPLGWFSTYPDQVIGAIQTLVAGIPLFVVLALVRSSRRPVGRAAQAAEVRPHRLDGHRRRRALARAR